MMFGLWESGGEERTRGSPLKNDIAKQASHTIVIHVDINQKDSYPQTFIRLKLLIEYLCKNCCKFHIALCPTISNLSSRANKTEIRTETTLSYGVYSNVFLTLFSQECHFPGLSTSKRHIECQYITRVQAYLAWWKAATFKRWRRFVSHFALCGPPELAIQATSIYEERNAIVWSIISCGGMSREWYKTFSELLCGCLKHPLVPDEWIVFPPAYTMWASKKH